MFEKVNPSHPDKVADRIAGAIVDLAYKIDDNPKIAVEVLLGHGECNIIIESSNMRSFEKSKIIEIVERIAGACMININFNYQSKALQKNQIGKMRCGDNGIFKGLPLTEEEKELSQIARDIYEYIPEDGKYILDEKNGNLIICQSHIQTEKSKETFKDKFIWAHEYDLTINPLGNWTGGIDVDSGATNRKLGSDMGHSVTGGGLHGKDLSKADVSVNIYAFLKAQATKKPIELYCAIGDEYVDEKPYETIVEIARKFINEIGGFEKFAEWGLF